MTNKLKKLAKLKSTQRMDAKELEDKQLNEVSGGEILINFDPNNEKSKEEFREHFMWDRDTGNDFLDLVKWYARGMEGLIKPFSIEEGGITCFF